MKGMSFLGCLLAFFPGVSLLAQEFKLALGSDEAGVGSVVRIPLSLSTDGIVQGVQAVFDWDGAAGTGVDLVVDPDVQDAAEFVNFHIADDWMVLGATLVATPLTGNDILIATAGIECGPGPDATNTPIVFRDGVHQVSGIAPKLSNVVTVDGESVGKTKGLELVNGSFRCLRGPCPVENLVCERDAGVIRLSWSIGADPGCECASIEVRDANTDEVIMTLSGNATTVDIPCADLEGSGRLCVVCTGPDGAEKRACCDYVCTAFNRGDGNDDGILDISDAVTVLSCLFEGVLCPTCLDAADCNDDGAINTSDAVCVLGCVFGSGKCPDPPFPGCGVDETEDELDCAANTSCL